MSFVEGLPRLIFPEELFIYCGFINRIKISAHPHSHPRPHYHSDSYSHHHSNSYPHYHSNSHPHPQDCVEFISTCIGIFQ
jgi:hypothetical protein